MAATADRIEFNHLTEDDFTDAQVVRMHREIRHLAMAMVTLDAEDRPAHPAQFMARMSVFMTTGVEARCVAPEFLATLTSYAETSLKVYGEGGEK